MSKVLWLITAMASPVAAQAVPAASPPVPAAAQAVPVSKPIPLAPNKSDVDKVVCKSEDTLGSRLKAKKVCMTVKEWQEYVYWNREQVERWQESAQVPAAH